MEDVLRELQKAWNLTQEFDGPQMYAGAIKSDLELVETLCTKDTYADIVQALTELPAYARLAAARGYDGSLQKQAQVKAAREQMKDTIQKLREKIFFQSQSDLKASLCRQQPMVHVLLELVRAFTEAYDKAKRKKSLVDFSDIEHFALDILVNAKTKEPAVDLGIVLAMISSYKDCAIPEDVICFGEVGLSGEVRAVNMAKQRVAEAKKLGFSTCILPKVSLKGLEDMKGIRLIGVENVQEAMRNILQ